MNKIIEVLQNSYKTAAVEAERFHANRFCTFLDIVYSRIKYDICIAEYKAYGFAKLKDHSLRKSYLPQRVHLSAFANSYDPAYDSKEYIYRLIPEYFKRDIVFTNSDSEQKVEQFLEKHQSFFAKALNSYGGHAVKYIDQKEFASRAELISYLEKYNLEMLEEPIIQHAQLDKLNPNTVNTLRIVSLKNSSDEIKLLPMILRCGSSIEEKVDNISSGGLYCLLNDDGSIINHCFIQENPDKIDPEHGYILQTAPATGYDPSDFKLPYIDKARDMVKEVHKKLPNFAIAGFDIAITEKGPLIVEINTNPGLDINQNYYFAQAKGQPSAGLRALFEEHFQMDLDY